MAGPTIVAIASGAGGAALLDVWWKPKQERKAATTMLLAELLNNHDLCALQSCERKNSPTRIPLDFAVEVAGWDAAVPHLGSLPPDVLRSVLLLYTRYRRLNELVDRYSRLVAERSALPSGSMHRIGIQASIANVLEVFNTSLDTVMEHGVALHSELLPLTGIKTGKNPAPPRDLGKAVADARAARESREKKLRAALAGGEPPNPEETP